MRGLKTPTLHSFIFKGDETMTLRLANLFLIIFITLVAFAGCERARDMAMDSMPPVDPIMDMDETVTDPVKLVWLIDYPEGGKDAYIAWVASIAPTLQAPEEVVRIRSYDNRDPEMSPNRLVEFEFKSFLDAATYLNRPDIAAVFEELPNRSSDTTVHTFIERSDYPKEEGDWMVKGVYLIDYPLGGKQAYLEWVDSIAPVLIGPPQLKAIASYDNYYGESPHRMVTLEFATEADSDAYEAIEEVKAVETELDVRAGSWERHDFLLRPDYPNE